MPRLQRTKKTSSRQLHLLIAGALLASCLSGPVFAQAPPQSKEEEAKRKARAQQQQQQQQKGNGQQNGSQRNGQQQGGQQPRFLPPKDSARSNKGSPNSQSQTGNNAGQNNDQGPGRRRGPQQFGSGNSQSGSGNPNAQPKFLPKQPSSSGQSSTGQPSPQGQPGAQPKFLPKSRNGTGTADTSGGGASGQPSGQGRFLPKQPSGGGTPQAPLTSSGNAEGQRGRIGQPGGNWPPRAGGSGAPANAFIPKGPTGPIGAPVPGKVVTPLSGPKHLDEVKRARVETVGAGGARVIKEPGNRTIIKQDNRTVIVRNETTVIQNFARGAQTKRRPDGIVETVYTRPGGYRVYSEVDGQGRLLRRYGVGPGGRQLVYVDNRRFYRNLAIGVGVGLAIGAAYVALAPPAIAIPRERYIVDYRVASYDDCYEALSAPPVEVLDRRYSLEEIRFSEPLRARMRRVDLDTITFEFGSFEVTQDQYPQLENIARAIGKVIEANPAEVFMIEGHTDAVGSPEDNLSLSDRRAESVARILVEHFNIPIENLVTQGYGEQFLKVQTQEPERANRRVAIRRITPLLSQGGDGAGPGGPEPGPGPGPAPGPDQEPPPPRPN